MIDEIFSFEYDRTDHKGDKWDVSEMMKLRFRQKALINPSFFRVFNEHFNMTKPIRKEFHYRSTGERNITAEITGATGIGKSLVSITIAVDWMNKVLVVEDIVFTTEAILTRAMEIGKNHTLIRDEQTEGFGIGSNREEEERKTLEATTRKFGLNIIFNSPDTKDHSTAHYNLEVICINRKKRMTKVAIIGYQGQYLGYFSIKVLPDNNKLWIAYNKRKDEFIKSVIGRSTARLSLDDMSKALHDHKHYRYTTTKEEKKILCMKLYPTLTIGELSMIVDNLKLMDKIKRGTGK